MYLGVQCSTYCSANGTEYYPLNSGLTLLSCMASLYCRGALLHQGSPSRLQAPLSWPEAHPSKLQGRPSHLLGLPSRLPANSKPLLAGSKPVTACSEDLPAGNEALLLLVWGRCPIIIT